MIDNFDWEIIGGSETILIVEDEELVTRVLRRALESLGYTVNDAIDGNAAVDFIKTCESRIDLLLLDIGIPGRSAREVMSVLMETHPGAKVILCSGSELSAETKALLQAGAKAFLRKPYRLDNVASVVREVLDKKG